MCDGRMAFIHQIKVVAVSFCDYPNDMKVIHFPTVLVNLFVNDHLTDKSLIVLLSSDYADMKVIHVPTKAE